MSYQITCVDRTEYPIKRFIVKTVDTYEEAVDYCANRNLTVGANYMGEKVQHYFERIVVKEPRGCGAIALIENNLQGIDIMELDPFPRAMIVGDEEE